LLLATVCGDGCAWRWKTPSISSRRCLPRSLPRQGAPASARTWRIVGDRRLLPQQDVLTRVLFALF